eukprot:Filipodium_phascolosomae@DN2771_c0_g1_i2.p1
MLASDHLFQNTVHASGTTPHCGVSVSAEAMLQCVAMFQCITNDQFCRQTQWKSITNNQRTMILHQSVDVFVPKTTSTHLHIHTHATPLSELPELPELPALIACRNRNLFCSQRLGMGIRSSSIYPDFGRQSGRI